MRSNFGRVALGAAAVIVAVVLLIVLQEDDDGGSGADSGAPSAGQVDSRSDGKMSREPDEPAITTILVRNGKPVGGVQELSYDAGERVRFGVRSDAADELHVHGYDVEEELPAGRPVRVEFPATIEGVFEAELHGSGEQIAELRIEP
jgi:hypothetical protein